MYIETTYYIESKLRLKARLSFTQAAWNRDARQYLETKRAVFITRTAEKKVS